MFNSFKPFPSDHGSQKMAADLINQIQLIAEVRTTLTILMDTLASQLGGLSASCACVEAMRVSCGLLGRLSCPLLRASGGSSLRTSCQLNGAQTRVVFVLRIADLESSVELDYICDRMRSTCYDNRPTILHPFSIHVLIRLYLLSFVART